MTLNRAIRIMTDEIVSILGSNMPSVYLFGSVVLNDFKPGWSDIDILVLTEGEINEQKAEILVGLRQILMECYPGNPFFRLFEGGMLSSGAFLNDKKERAVYWGTSGQRICEGYKLDSFGMIELLENGKLLFGRDIRGRMAYPAYAHMRDDIANHVKTARKYGDGRWLLDIARGIYTLRTGKVIAKTAAGEWAIGNTLCPDAEDMKKTVAIRQNPPPDLRKSITVDNAVVQRFADVIDSEFSATVRNFAESELRRMNIEYSALSLIRNKDGVSVWRVTTGDDSVVMKCFDKAEYRRETNHYRILRSLGIPTLELIAHTDCSVVLEDIERSAYRLAAMEDLNVPDIAEKIALWYKTLHHKGRGYVNTHDFTDEYDTLTPDNIKYIQHKTGTGSQRVWRLIEDRFDEIRSFIMSLPRTLAYTDFHYTNLAVARDGSGALMFDYNFLFKSYAYSDIRNVCGSLYNADAKKAFLAAYGTFDEREAVADDVASVLSALITACSRKVFPDWAKGLLEQVNDGRLLTSAERMLETLCQTGE